MPEFTAPGIGNQNNTVTVDAEIGENASGVLYAMGGSGGGVTLYMDKGQLVYEYNMMIIERYIARSVSKIAPGKRRIEITTKLESAKPLTAAGVILKVKSTVPAAFSASETFDVGVDLGSTVSLDYFDRRPFRFDGKIELEQLNCSDRGRIQSCSMLTRNVAGASCGHSRSSVEPRSDRTERHAASRFPCSAPGFSRLSATSVPRGRGRKPNILVIMGDDVGWMNVSSYGGDVMGVKTPNIDRIAHEGIRLTSFYRATELHRRTCRIHYGNFRSAPV